MKLYLIWQDAQDRSWHPVGLLRRDRGVFVFAYTFGAKASKRFIPFGNLTKYDAVYVSNKLFPIFSNRVLSEKRPDFKTYASWAGFKTGEEDPLLLMARMGGVRATDSLQVYQAPKKTVDGRYRSVFYCHGIRHMPEDAQRRVLCTKVGDRLYPMLDVQNKYDKDAVSLRTEDPTTMIGYCPRHISSDIRLLCERSTGDLTVSVKQTNSDAPLQFQLLLEIDAQWPVGFEPCSGEEYQTIVDVDALLKAHFSNRPDLAKGVA